MLVSELVQTNFYGFCKVCGYRTFLLKKRLLTQLLFLRGVNMKIDRAKSSYPRQQ